MELSPKQLIDDVKGLVSLPEACVRINEMVDDPNSSADDIGKVLSQDPSLTVRILKIANSPFYGLSNQVETVARAVAIMGTKQLRDMVLATSAARTFDGIPNNLISMKEFWFHNIACGIASRVLAENHLKGKVDSLFVAGLLHDIGQLVMFNKLPDQSREVLVQTLEASSSEEMYHAEKKILGFTHCDVGVELAREWHLPPLYQECIAFHHSPSEAKEFPREVALVHIAQATACMVEIDSIEEDELNDVHEEAWKLTGLTRSDIPPQIDLIRSQISEVMNTFMN